MDLIGAKYCIYINMMSFNMDEIIAFGTFSVCVLISVVLYRYRTFLTQIFIVGSLAIWLWSMAMMAYALNNKHNLWKLVQENAFKVFETYLETVAHQEPSPNSRTSSPEL